MYDSKGEAGYAMELDGWKRSGHVLKWERQVKVALVVNGKKVCTIVPDFLVTYPEGRVEYHEYKGRATPLWRLKVKLFQALFPEAQYRVIWG
jgi:hypothetical protein